MEREKFIELVHTLSDQDSIRLLASIMARYSNSEEFISYALEKIEEIEKYNSELY